MKTGAGWLMLALLLGAGRAQADGIAAAGDVLQYAMPVTAARELLCAPRRPCAVKKPHDKILSNGYGMANVVAGGTADDLVLPETSGLTEKKRPWS